MRLRGGPRDGLVQGWNNRGRRLGYLGCQPGFGGAAETRGDEQKATFNISISDGTSTADATATPPPSSWPATPPRPTWITSRCWSPANRKSANTAPSTSSATPKSAAPATKPSSPRRRNGPPPHPPHEGRMGSCGFAFAPPPLLPRPYLPVVRRAQSHKNVRFRRGRESPPQRWIERDSPCLSRLCEPWQPQRRLLSGLASVVQRVWRHADTRHK